MTMTYQFRIMVAVLMVGAATVVTSVASAQETAPETVQDPSYTVLNPAPAPAPQPAPVPAPQVQPQQPQPDPRAAIVQARLDEQQARIAERQRIREERLREKEETRRSGKPMIVSGASLLGAGYGASAIVGGMMLDGGSNDAAYMFIPLVGSPITLTRILSDSDYNGPTFMLSLAMLAPAICQVTGTALLATGLVKRSRYNKERSVAVTPIITPELSGLSVSATF